MEIVLGCGVCCPGFGPAGALGRSLDSWLLEQQDYGPAAKGRAPRSPGLFKFKQYTVCFKTNSSYGTGPRRHHASAAFHQSTSTTSSLSPFMIPGPGSGRRGQRPGNETPDSRTPAWLRLGPAQACAVAVRGVEGFGAGETEARRSAGRPTWPSFPVQGRVRVASLVPTVRRSGGRRTASARRRH